jgi:hypothetical protein
MSYLGARNAVSLGVSYQATLGGPNLLNKLSPSLLLNFTNTSTLDPRITFTRSTTATFTGSNGLIQTAAIDAPRFDYNPTTLASLGLLIEEQRVNLWTYSEQFDNAAWTKTNSSITANTVIAPDGALTGDKITSNISQLGFVVQSLSQTTGTAYTVSVYAKAGEYNFCQLRITGTVVASITRAYFNLANGTTTGVANCTASITPAGNGWYRCSITYTTVATATASPRIYGQVNASDTVGDGTSGIYIWGAQLEAGAFATSYIPTVASQVTRAADFASITGTNFSSWYNASEGTFYADFTPLSSDYLANKNLFLASDNTASNFNGLRYVTSGSRPGLGVTSAGATQANISTGTMVAGTSYRIAGAYKVNDFAVSRNGAAAGTDTSGTVPVVNRAEIGALAGANIGSQHLARLAYYPRRLANAELQGITR